MISAKSILTRNRILFFGCVFVWFVFDRIVKEVLNSAYSQGDIITSNIMGLFSFNMVHNTGVAWGAFSDSTLLITIASIVICLIVAIYAHIISKQARSLEMISLGLILAGGLGNLFDRVVFGYVVDFITPTFIDFPTFNLADIGVSCGVVLFLISLLLSFKQANSPKGDS